MPSTKERSRASPSRSARSAAFRSVMSSTSSSAVPPSSILPANSPHQREPSLRMYSFSKGVPWPVAFSSSMPRRVCGIHSGGVSSSQRSRPASTSSRAKPDMRRKAALASVIRPAKSKKITPTVSISATRRNRSSLARSRASRSRRSPVARKRSTAAEMRLA